MLAFTVDEHDHCRPLGSWLMRLLPLATAGYRHQLVRKGHLTVNGSPAAEQQPLLLGDRLLLKESARTRALLAHAPPLLDIIYEDTFIVALNKPPGLPMHPAAEVGPDNLVDRATAFLHQRDQTIQPSGQPPGYRLRPVNRLDRGTSGSVLLAKSATAAGMFGTSLQENGLGKLYLALVSGSLKGSGEVTAPVEGKEACTRYRALFTGRETTLVALWPQTGRMHQLRQHLRHLRHPIIGDRRYGGPSLPAYPGHLLHSLRTWFTHPADGQEVDISAPLPAPFLDRLRSLAGDAFPLLLNSLPGLRP